MNLKSTIKQITSATMVAATTFFALNASAQSSPCANEGVLWIETFGQGTTAEAHPNVYNINFDATGNPLSSEGTYRVANSTQQTPEWHASADHTGDADGRMLVVNGESAQFFQKTIEFAPGFAPGIYRFGFFAMNVNTLGTCGSEALLPEFDLIVEYLDAASVWVPLVNSPFSANAIAQSASATWVEVGANYYLPDFGPFTPHQIRVTIGNRTRGGCGNDFAIDDIKFSLCPEGGPVPVTFTTVSAQLKGSGVTIDWSTAQEVNNDRFEVERSANGSDGWKSIATVAGAGFSQLPQHYSAFDASPLAGVNFYRIKQIDKDGRSAYSKTVSARSAEAAGMKVSIAGNPFRSNFTIKFSGASGEVNARLIDMSGKQIASESWNLSAGENNKQFSNISGIHTGIYILTVHSKSGEVLFNGKVLKQ